MKQKIKIVKLHKELENGKESHLYATVSQDVEPIKEGDWCIDFYEFSDKPVLNIAYPKDICPAHVKQHKIIATTEPKLRVKTSRNEKIVNPGVYEKPLPQVSQSFLKEFVANPYGEFNAEYNCLTSTAGGVLDLSKNPCWKQTTPSKCMEWKLKLNQDNTVNITLVKEKMHSDEKVKNLLMTALFEPSPYNVDEAMNWIKENL